MSKDNANEAMSPRPTTQGAQRANGVNPVRSLWEQSPLPAGNLHHVLRPGPAKQGRGMLTLRPLPQKPGKIVPEENFQDFRPSGRDRGTAGTWDPHCLATDAQLQAPTSSDTSSEGIYDMAVNTPIAHVESIPNGAAGRESRTTGRRPSFDVVPTVTERRTLGSVDRDGILRENTSVRSLNPRSPAPNGSEVVLSKTEEEFLKQRRASLASVGSNDSLESLAFGRSVSDGENSKARWAKVNWYAMQKAGGSRQDKSLKHVQEAEGTEKIASMVNVVVFAMHWQKKALGNSSKVEPTPREGEQGGKSPLQPQGQEGPGAAEYLALIPGFVRWALTMLIIVGWDVNVLLDDAGGADQALYTAFAVLLVVFAADVAWQLGRRRMELRSGQCLLDVASCLSLLPEAVYAVAGVDILGAGGHGRWPVAVRAVRAGFRLSVGVGAISYLLHAHAESRRPDKVPESLRADMEGDKSKPVRVAVGDLVDLQTALVVSLLLLAHFVVKLLAPSHPLHAQPGTAAALAMACSGGGGGSGGVEVLVREAGGWQLPLLHLRVCGEDVVGSAEAVAALRSFPSAVVEYAARGPEGCECGLAVDGSGAARAEAAENLTLMLAVVLIILGATRLMRELFEREVVGPLESMQRRVIQMLRKPMRAPAKPEQHRQVHEGFVVENVVTRFSTLLRVSLGEAGGKIVTANLTDGAGLDRSLPGKIVNGIFGFCDIRNFTDLTEVLQADVIRLVNTVAVHVHEAVTANYGAPNKNIGDAFLLVWKPNRGRQVEEVADAALKALVDIVQAMRASADLAAIARRADVQQRMPGFKVHMGFGLHYGWAVEGAIGSARKIDASYLSPHVNLAARLESATKQYGVPILLSESMRALLSPAVQGMLRLLDRVVVKGASQPLRLYTFDCWDSPSDFSPAPSLSDDALQAAGGGAGRGAAKAAEGLQPASTAEYRRDFMEAVEWYLGGESGQLADWVKASALLKDCRCRCPQDGAAKALLDVIADLAGPDGQPPAGWSGYRALTEK